MSLTEKYGVPLAPTFTPHDVHIRQDAAGPAWIGVYDRQAGRWYDTVSGTLTPERAVAALGACAVRS